MTAPGPEQDPRIYMAAERTFLAWIRTGVAMMGFGFVVARFGFFLREMASQQVSADSTRLGVSLPIGIALISVGIVVIFVSMIRHRRYIEAIDRNDFRSAFGSRFAMIVSALLCLVGIAMAVYLARL
jgi:putative membrane protein